MSARLGVVTQQGLGETLVNELQHSVFKWPLILLLLIALYGGNAAYEAGNLTGGVLGITALFGESTLIKNGALVFLSFISGFILLRGSYKQIEKFLLGLVVIMALAFILTFLVVKPNLVSMFSGMLIPNIPDGSLLTVIALVGTTIVPYNLFLHASAVKNRWCTQTKLNAARTDTVVSISLGGLVAILICSTAAVSIYANALKVESATDMALQFEPLFGALSKYLLGLGLFAAGLSSAITAPLATGFVVSEIFQIEGGEKSPYFKLVCLSVLASGCVLALTGIKPLKLILLAQFANGLLLPIVACFLLFALNRKKLLKEHTNGLLANSLGGLVVIFTAALGLRLILKTLSII